MVHINKTGPRGPVLHPIPNFTMSAQVFVNKILVPVELLLVTLHVVLYYALLVVCRTVAWFSRLLWKLLRGYFRYAYIELPKKRSGRRGYAVTPMLDATVTATCLVLAVMYAVV